MSEQHINYLFNRQGFKVDANYALIRLRISAVPRECNSTAELIFDVNVYSILRRRCQNCS